MGTHTVTVKHKTGNYLDLDALQVLSPLVWGYYEETERNLAFNGTWSTVTATGPSGGAHKSTATTDDSVWFQFEDEEVTLFRAMGPDRGSMEVCIDGTCQPISNYQSSLAWAVPYTVDGLPYAVHTVTITNQSGVLDLDAVRVGGEPVTGYLMLGMSLEGMSLSDEMDTEGISSQEDLIIDPEKEQLLPTPTPTAFPTPDVTVVPILEPTLTPTPDLTLMPDFSTPTATLVRGE